MAEHTAHATNEMEDNHEFTVHEIGIHHVDSSKKQIWTVFFVLLIITVLEFFIALTPGVRPWLGKDTTVAIFLGLTVLKAFYIVGYFMHLKMEKMNMVYSILLPILFILYLITLLMIEGHGSVGAHAY